MHIFVNNSPKRAGSSAVGRLSGTGQGCSGMLPGAHRDGQADPLSLVLGWRAQRPSEAQRPPSQWLMDGGRIGAGGFKTVRAWNREVLGEHFFVQTTKK